MSLSKRILWLVSCTAICLAVIAQAAESNGSQPNNPEQKKEEQKPKPDFPPHTEVLKDYEQVISTVDKGESLLSLYVRKKDDQVLAALPRKFEDKRFFIALTVASGERYAGLQAGEIYAYWKRQDKRMLLIEPNVTTRSTGDPQSKASVKRLFTDRVLVDVPIVTVLPNGAPVIDLDGLLVGEAAKFFGNYTVRGIKSHLATVQTAKAFPSNVEVAFEVPVGDGTLKTLHYSISEIKASPGFKPRLADERVGFFTTSFADLGKYEGKDTQERYINRWHLEKADPKLKVSPTKDPIIFYVDHTTPIRYRRWVREGVLMWNKAFEKVGLDSAIEVHYQDATTGAHMEKNPEDVRYNFIRWLNNNVGTAIGPSRVNPLTGEILDADIILTDGWIRHYWRQFNEMLPELAMEGFSPETLAWLRNHPQWDPRVRLAPPAARDAVIHSIRQQPADRFGGHAVASVDPTLMGDQEYDGLIGRTSQINGLCRAAECKALDMAVTRFSLELARAEAEEEEEGEGKDKDKEDKKPEEPKDEMLDGIPEWFVGPLLAELVAHEVGHTLGLRHNFKASSIYNLKQINSGEVKGKKAFAGSVMDYLPVNMARWQDKENGGDHAMIDIGPYDAWAIEYGYTLGEKPDDLKAILARVAEPELQYATDEDTWGPDPYARRYDFGADPLAYAVSQMELANHHRGRLLDKFVKEGESWAKARYGYELTLSVQSRSLSMMANWIGGAFVNRDKKGDPNGRAPIDVVPSKEQREALRFVIDNTFKDEAFGLDSKLLRHLTTDRWLDRYPFGIDDATWPVHDRIMGIQASVLTMLMNPSTLGRVYDNEFLTPADQDMITLPEILGDLKEAIWRDLADAKKGHYTARQPLISSLTRNLQREHLERLIDLSISTTWRSTSYKPVSNLALHQLRGLKKQIGQVLEQNDMELDPYSEAHLSEAKLRIEKALEAGYIYNADSLGGGMGNVTIILGKDGEETVVR